MEFDKLRSIDVELHASGSCRNAGINSCCRRAVESQAAKLGEVSSSVASAVLQLTCEGKDPVLGCQAQITGELLDADGVWVADVDTTAQELARLDPPETA